MPSRTQSWWWPIRCGLLGGAGIAVVDNLLFEGEVSPIVVVGLLLLVAASAATIWGARGLLAAALAWAWVPAAHVAKRVLGMPDTLHPNTWSSVLMLAVFTLMVVAIGSGFGLLARRAAARAAAGVILALCSSAVASAQTHNQAASIDHPSPSSMTRAYGTFDVKVTPQSPDNYADGTALGRLTIDKQFHGDLEATSKGQMLSAMTTVQGSAGYVAIERVSGTLAGRRGTFVLQHIGTMTRGAQQLSVTVVPDSGTEGLAGLTGTMTIDLAGGRHAYEFTYSLPTAP